MKRLPVWEASFLCLVFQDEGLTGTKFQIFGEIVITSSQDVLGSFRITDDFRITFDIHNSRLRCTIEDSESCTSFVLTGNDVNAVIRNKLRLLALRDDLVALSPMQKSTCPLEHLLFSFGTSLFRKGVMRIIRESARDVFTDITVRHFFRTVHQNFRTIIELRNAIDSQQQSKCLFEHEGVAAITQEAVCIMVIDERHDG